MTNILYALAALIAGSLNAFTGNPAYVQQSTDKTVNEDIPCFENDSNDSVWDDMYKNLPVTAEKFDAVYIEE